MSHFVRDLFVATRTEALRGLRLTLCGGGGIAAIELPKIAREFRRHGAQVRFFVTENCLRFVGKEALEWASEAPVIVNPSGFAEHICHDDAVIVLPATANLLGKFAWGICSDGVSTLVQSALGHRVPLIICPTMHESLSLSPIVTENRKRLEQLPGVHFIPPRVEEGKQKSPPPEKVVLETCHILNARRNFGDSSQPHVLVTFGGTRASLDTVRCVTNHSTGALGGELIRLAYRLGMRVTAVEGNVQIPLEPALGITLHRVPEYSDMLACLSSLRPEEFDAVFHIAAVSDYVPSHKSQEKISSDQDNLTISLVRSQKFLELENLRAIPFQVACKLTSGTDAEGLEAARRFSERHRLDALLWNRDSVLGAAQHAGVVLTRTGDTMGEHAQQSKTEIAQALVAHFLSQRGRHAR